MRRPQRRSDELRNDSFAMSDVFNSGPLAPRAGTANVASLEGNPTLRLAVIAARAAEERKGTDVTLLEVTEVSYLADYFVLVSGFSAVQVRAIARSVEEALETECNRRPLRTEGLLEGSWVLQDFGEVIVHIFLPDEREFYNLEAFWGHAHKLDYEALAACLEVR